ncbi:MAG: HAD-IA family hydrolase [Pseudomonadales bacterium]|nr:HAD-IA family hydrolase [Pseudomonadales bacterium]
MSQRFQLITFDLDDTLWDVRPVLLRAEQQVNEWMMQHCPEVPQRFSRAELMSLRLRLLRERPELHHHVSELRRESMRLALLDCGYGDTSARQLAAEAFAVFIEARHDIEPFAGVVQCLEQLSQHYMLGALTNGNADIFRLSLGKYFRFAFNAEALAASKPQAAHFNAALAAAQTSAEHCIHIGDHHEHDMLGAQRLGITTVWFNPDQRPWSGEEPPKAVFRAFSELVALIDELESSG